MTRRAVPKDAAALQVFSESRQTVVQNRSLQLRFDPQERFPPATRTAYDLGAVMVGTDGNRYHADGPLDELMVEQAEALRCVV